MSTGEVRFTVTNSAGVPSSASASYTIGAPVGVRLPDFPNPGIPALWQKSGAFDGKGATYAQAPNSTTKSNVASGTTPWFLMMFGYGSGSVKPTDVDVGNFELAGVPQNGLWFHGLRIGYSTGARVHDVRIRGCVGAGSSPPRETFGNTYWHADNALAERVYIDGRDAGGNPVGASLMATNNLDGFTWRTGAANGTALGFGLTLWQTSGRAHPVIVSDVDLRANRKAVNIERNTGGVYRFIRCDFRGVTGAAYMAQISSNSLTDSAKISFEDCLFDNDKCVVNTYQSPGPVRPDGSQNGQKDADITRVINGTVLSDGQDPARFDITHT